METVILVEEQLFDLGKKILNKDSPFNFDIAEAGLIESLQMVFLNNYYCRLY